MKRQFYIFIFSALISLTANTAFAQKTGGSINLNPVNPCQLFVPNAFTPNGDNINELFSVKYNGECNLLNFEMHIFDRWGRLVFETKDADPLKAWDGTTDGMELKEGVYMWKVRCTLVDPNKPNEAQVINEQGTVVLIR